MKTIKSLLCSLLVGVVMASLSACCYPPAWKDAKEINQFPKIFPDYVGVTVPANIAPLDFNMADEDIEDMYVCVQGPKTIEGLYSYGKKYAEFEVDEWHDFLKKNKGEKLIVSVFVEKNGEKLKYKDFNIYVSPYELKDWGLTYRRIAPGYEVYGKLGIYQRNLSNFEETAILENTAAPGACLNCHTANRTNPDQFTFHVRGDHGATLVSQNGKREWLKAKNDSLKGSMVYPYWHPSGKYIAYSTNTTRQVFHISHNNRVEVFDAASDIQVYDIDNNELIVTPLLKRDSIYETFPAFSADGKTLYFCAANALPDGSSDFQKVHYSLCSVSFDESTGSFGNHIDTLVDCSMCCDTIPGSVSFPRPSYDGRFLVYTYADYGQFTIWHHEADLWIMDLATGERRNLTKANSADTDSFHNWSSNSRWMVISSRRDDGLFTRPYFCHIDAEGNASKAFMLPQKNPKRHYQELYMSYNVPDFISGSVAFDNVAATDLINQKERKPMKVREQ